MVQRPAATTSSARYQRGATSGATTRTTAAAVTAAKAATVGFDATSARPVCPSETRAIIPSVSAPIAPTVTACVASERGMIGKILASVRDFVAKPWHRATEPADADGCERGSVAS